MKTICNRQRRRAAKLAYMAGNQRTTFTNAAGTYVQYAYDPAGQLKVADSSVNTEDRGFAYDTAWNLNYRTNNGTPTTFSVDGKNQLTTVGSASYSYDANGNLTNQSTGSTGYAYDSENRLISVQYVSGVTTKQTTFAYDGLSRLRKQLQWTWSSGGGGGSSMVQGGVAPAAGGGGGGGSWNLTSGIYYIYDGNRVIQERDTNNTPTVSYTRGNDLSGSLEGAGGIGGLLARSDTYSSGNFTSHNYYHADGNGNITYLETSAQGLGASYRYDAFGNTLSSSGTYATANTYRFSSKEWVPSVSGYYYLYRFYRPDLQRWLNRDPIGERGGLNLYDYVSNDPIERIDPLGEDDGPKDQPPVTSPPSFGDKQFQEGRDNCLCYGLDSPGRALQPDGGDGRNNAKGCPELLNQLKKSYKGVGNVPKDGKCPAGSHKITVSSDGDGGYHVQRQDSDGGWSEMSLGAGPGQTYPPRKCKKGGGGSPGKPCGDLCAPDQPK